MAWTNEDISGLRARIADRKFFRLNYLKLKLIDACNLRCPKCDYWQIQKKPELDLNDIKDLIGQGQELGLQAIHLSGGEPTLRKDLVDMVHFGSKRGIDYRIITNGTYLKPEKAVALAKAGISGWTFSLDGSNHKQHDVAMGRKGSFRKLIDSVKALVESRDQHSSPTDVSIATVVTRENIFDLIPLIELVYGLGVDNIKLSPFDYRQTTVNTTGDASITSLNPSEADIQRYNLDVVPQLLEFSRVNSFPIYPSTGLEIFGKSDSEIRLGAQGLVALGTYERQPCFMPWQHLTVYANGDIHVCCKRPTTKVGNVRTDRLADVVNNEIMIKTRQLFAESKAPYGCGSCAMKLYENNLIGGMLEK